MIQFRSQTTESEYIIRTNEDGSESWIPADPANSDYQAYLASLEA